jgi:competence protein ComEC
MQVSAAGLIYWSRMDRIEYSIELLRRRISPEYTLLNHTVTKCPLILPACGVISGILLYEYFSVPMVLTVAALPAALLLAEFKRNNRRAVIALLVLAAGIFLGSARMSFFNRSSKEHINSYSFNENVPQIISAEILTRPRKQPPDNWKFSFADFGARRTSMYARVTSVFDSQIHRKASGKILVTLPISEGSETFQNLLPGTHITMHCLMNEAHRQSNPGTFDFAGYLKNKRIRYIAFTNNIKAFTVTGRDRYSFNGLSGSFRAATLKLLSKGFTKSDPALDMAAAIALGERSALPQDVYESLRKSGLMHLLSLSGLHVGMISAMIWWIGKLFAMTRRQRGFLCLIFLVIFCLAVPPRAPVLRAAVVCVVFCFSAILGKRAISFNTLALAAILLLIYNPRNLFTPGFILSFLAIGGILLFYKPIQLRLVSLLRIERLDRGILRSMCYYVLSALSMGTSAMIFGAGACLHFFYGTNILSPLWTMLSMPVFSVLLLAGLIKIPAAALIPGVEQVLNPVISSFAFMLGRLIDLTASLNTGFIQTGGVSTAAIPALYVSLIALAYSLHYQNQKFKRLAAVGIFAAIAFIGVNKWCNSHPPGLRLTIFSVGHGVCSFVTLPDSSSYILDCGSSSIDNPGQNIIMKYAAFRDIESADAVILSHNHLDHVNGIDAVKQGLLPERIVVNGYFCDQSRSVARAVMSIGGEIINAEPAPFSDCGAEFSFYSAKNISSNDINAQSLVTFIKYAGRKIIIPGDLPPPHQLEMIHGAVDVKADVLILPHHGFAEWTDPLFIETVSPAVAVGSCKKSDYQKRRLEYDKTAAYYTAENGCVEVLIKPDGEIIVETMY